MADDNQEKSEAPTERRREESRKDGQVAFSKELNATILLGAFLLLFYFMSDVFLSTFREMMTNTFNNLDVVELSIPFVGHLFANSFNKVAGFLIPVFMVTLVVGAVASVSQVGFLITLKVLAPKFDKLSPLKGFGRYFSKQTFNELFKSIFKIALLSYLGYYTFTEKIDAIMKLIELNVYELIGEVWSLVGVFALRVFFAMLVLSGFDYFFQRWDFEQKLKMSKQDIKEESKQMEGDPQIKAKIKEIQRQMSQGRMMQEVPEADTVITNPTHFAVAIKYDRETMSSPQVTAKGIDFQALRIMEIAKNSEVPLMRNPAISRALYFNVEIGQDIPEEFFKAVAEILAFVYKTKKKR